MVHNVTPVEEIRIGKEHGLDGGELLLETRADDQRCDAGEQEE
jgi:hypothetical protein